MNCVKIIWSDDFSGQEMATLIRDKFDISVSYFIEDYDFGIRINKYDYNSKILNFIKKKVGDISVLEESKESTRKSIEESKTMTFEEFKKLCDDTFGYAIMDFNEYKGSYIVVVSADEKATEKFAKILGKHGLEYTFYELKDPNSEYYRCYEIMCV